MADSTLTVPRMSKKVPSAPGLSVLSPAPSLLSLRSVIDFMPSDIRIRYKDTARYSIWPECPLDSDGKAIEINEEDELDGSISNLSTKMKRNLTVKNANGAVREYSKFGNTPVLIDPNFNKPGRHRRISETMASGYQSYSPFRQRKAVKDSDRSAAYYSSKDGGVRLVPVSPSEITRL